MDAVSRRLAFGGCLVLAQLLASCGSTPQPSLRIGTNVWIGNEPLFLARDLGFFDKSSIRLVELTSAAAVDHALRSGNLEAAVLTLALLSDSPAPLRQDANELARFMLRQHVLRTPLMPTELTTAPQLLDHAQ